MPITRRRPSLVLVRALDNARTSSNLAAHRGGAGLYLDATVTKVHGFRLNWFSAAF